MAQNRWERGLLIPQKICLGEPLSLPSTRRIGVKNSQTLAYDMVQTVSPYLEPFWRDRLM